MNPYDDLVKMLETRLTRQRAALKETENQLDGSRKMRDDFQKDLVEQAKKAPK